MSEYQKDLMENHIQGMGLKIDGVPAHKDCVEASDDQRNLEDR